MPKIINIHLPKPDKYLKKNILKKTCLKQTIYHIFALSKNEKSIIAGVVKLVDTPDLGSGAARCVGSSPITRT